MTYHAKLFLGSTSEGSSQTKNYYFLDSDDRQRNPPLLVVTDEDNRFQSVQDAATELRFMIQTGIRQKIVVALESLGVKP